MGNRLCCDPAVIKYSQEDVIKRANSEIQQFMQANPSIQSVCKTPGRLFGTVDNSNILDYDQGVYIGRDIDLKRNGLGLMIFRDKGFYYEGEWFNDKFQGRGFLAIKNGDFYHGEWKNGLPHGQGIYVSSEQKWRYEGQWEQGKQQGKGEELFLESGQHFKGNFNNGQRQGRGIYISNKQGFELEGQIKAYGPDGFASLKTLDFAYQGEWKNGEINGTGHSYWINDEVIEREYIGEYLSGEKHGFGEYHDKTENKKFKGKWEYGQMTNQGIFIESEKH